MPNVDESMDELMSAQAAESDTGSDMAQPEENASALEESKQSSTDEAPSDPLNEMLNNLTKVPEEVPAETEKPDGTAGEPGGGNSAIQKAKPEEKTTANAPRATNSQKESAAGAQQEKKEAAKTPETDEQLMSELNNPRSKARMQTILAERKQAIDASQRFLQAVQGAGYDDETFGQVLQFGRLLSSEAREDKVQALQMLDKVRENIARDIGEPVAGIDVLADEAPDLKQKVASLEMTEEGALEVLRARKLEQARQARYQSEQAQQQNQQQTIANIERARQEIVSFAQTRANELDFAPKMQAIKEWLQDPEHMQSLVSQPPAQWRSAIAFLYQNIAVRKVQPRSPQPLTSTNIARGRLAMKPGDPRGSLENTLKNLGI